MMESNIPEKMLAASQDVEKQMAEAGKALKAYIVEKESADGSVSVRVDGSMEIRKIVINGVENEEIKTVLNETLEAIRVFQEKQLMELPFVQAMQ